MLVVIHLGYECPAAYPFAYENGDSCCKRQEGEMNQILLYESRTCNGETIGCPRKPCYDNYGKCIFIKESIKCLDNYILLIKLF